MESEKWRKEFGTDDLVRDFNYVEKPKVFEYYPQYYHKTDKVSLATSLPGEERRGEETREREKEERRAGKRGIQTKLMKIGWPTCVH